LGNIAWRTSGSLHLDPKTGRIQDGNAAATLWRRSYRPGWEPKV
jgi:hypothetical protein